MTYRSLVVAAVISWVVAPSYAEEQGRAVVREVQVEVDAEMVRSWASSRCGEEIRIPWFDGEELAAKVGHVDVGEELVQITAEVPAERFGSLLLTLAEDAFTGAVTIDGAVHRLRGGADGRATLAEIDPNLLSPDTRDTNQERVRPARPGIVAQSARAGFLSRISVRRLIEGITAQLDRRGALYETGERIDVLVAVTHAAADWAESEGMNLGTEIATMLGVANQTYANSGIVPRFHHVGTAFVDYEVKEPEKLELDANNLRDGAGSLAVLHELRDALGADVVHLLVLNGMECAGVDAFACGYGFTQRKLAGPGDAPGSKDWEDDFASLGFSVSSIYSSFGAYTFVHEVSHNLGAHHDWFSFAQDGYDPTADPFAKGWILVQNGIRSVMAYNRLCAEGELGESGFCRIEPFFSNPLQTYFGERRGDPEPGYPPTWLGPADNATAINRMARTVASYRVVIR